MQLADSLLLTLSQRLVMKKDRSGLCTRIREAPELIQDQKLHPRRQDPSDQDTDATSREEYSSIDVSLARLATEGLISVEEGLKHADNLAFYQETVRGKVTK